MADPVRRISSGGKHFDFAGLTANEMIQVTKWTGFKRRREFYDAIRDEDPNAVLAAFSLAAWREAATENPPRWGAVDVDLDDLDGFLHIDGRKVEMLLEERDGKTLFVVAGKDGVPKKQDGEYVTDKSDDEQEQLVVIPLTTEDGKIRYRYSDTGEEVDPTESIPGSTVSRPTDQRSGDDSESASRLLADELV